MITGGDELGRTQRGNNNGYCQDTDISWFDWKSVDSDLVDFVRRAWRAIRQGSPHLPPAALVPGAPAARPGRQGRGLEFTPEAQEMSDEHWAVGFAKSLAVFFSGKAIQTPDAHGERVIDDDFLLFFNASHETVRFVIPEARFGNRWAPEIDTAALGDGTPADAGREGCTRAKGSR